MDGFCGGGGGGGWWEYGRGLGVGLLMIVVCHFHCYERVLHCFYRLDMNLPKSYLSVKMCLHSVD